MSELPPGFQLRQPSAPAQPELPAGFQLREPVANPAPTTPTAPAQPTRDANHQAAREWLDSHPEAQHGFANNMLAKVAQGGTMGWGDELLAGIASVRDSVKHGGMPWDHYAREKALQDEMLADASKSTGGYGTAAEVAGGLGSALATGGLGIGAIKAGQGWATRAGASALEGAGYGAVQGAGTADSGNTISGALGGAATGAAAGGVLSTAASLAKPLASNLVSHVTSRVDPTGYGRAKVGEAIGRSNRSVDDLVGGMQRAADDGQMNYTLADEMGDAGGDLLRGTMNQPGAEKNAAVEFFRERSGGQGQRLARNARDAFGAVRTSTAEEEAQKALRKAADDHLYPAASRGAKPVNYDDTLALLESMRDPGGVMSGATVSATDSIAPEGVERVAQMLTRRGVGNSYDALLAVKQRIGDAIGESMRVGHGHEAGQLTQLRNSLDSALEQSAGQPYRLANDTHAKFSQKIDAIPQGEVAFSELPEDAIANFNNVPQHAQPQFRTGFVQKMREMLVGNGNPYQNRASKLLDPGDQQKFESFAVTPEHGQRFNRQVRREDVMANTKNTAISGSSTARNLGAMEDMAVDPRVALNVAHAASTGNVLQALSSALGPLARPAAGGEAVRNEIIRTIMQTPQGVNQESLRALLQGLENGRQRMAQHGVNASRATAAFAPSLYGSAKHE